MPSKMAISSFPAAGGARLSLRILASELEVGDDDLLPPGQPVKGLVQQLHVQQFGDS